MSSGATSTNDPSSLIILIVESTVTASKISPVFKTTNVLSKPTLSAISSKLMYVEELFKFSTAS